MIFSRSCEYALQAVTFIASQPSNRPVLSRDISGALNIPPHFLGKILQTLVKHNILGSQKGKSGGFEIIRPPEEITLYDIIQVMDGPDYFEQCIMGFPGCFDHNPCPAHLEWKGIKEKLMKLLNARSISELSSDLDFKLEYIKKIVDKTAS
ncbi:MAG: Rrf2 family transcriptional regulator [Candidatus Marinimicrobia bacterium]|nr:Rrf2 family transcriptional regulator [Candidatus Neomarinimicrobiota bacterium]